jgi:hypothetical protein
MVECSPESRGSSTGRTARSGVGSEAAPAPANPRRAGPARTRGSRQRTSGRSHVIRSRAPATHAALAANPRHPRTRARTRRTSGPTRFADVRSTRTHRATVSPARPELNRVSKLVGGQGCREDSQKCAWLIRAVCSKRAVASRTTPPTQLMTIPARCSRRDRRRQD